MASRAFVVFLSPEEGHERATYMGYVSVAYGVGMVVGPSLGGYLSRFGLSLPAWAACAGSCVSALAAYILLSGTAATAAKAAAPKTDALSQPSRPWSSVLSHPALAGILAVKALATAASSVFQATFGLVGDERFGLDAQGMGFLLSIVGATGALSSLLLVKPVTAAFAGRDGALSMLSGGAMAALFAAFAFVNSTEQLYALTIALTAVSTVFAVANSAALSRAVPLSLKGTAVAVDMALGSGARIFAPAVCATLLRTGGFASIGASASAVMGSMVLLIAAGAIRVDAPALSSERGSSDELHTASKGKAAEEGIPVSVRKRSR
jgi:predicted MFS family arabinose efflux permease